jgi:hypothetical protein
MSTGAERREARRFTMTLPLRVLPANHHGFEMRTETRDVSYRGLYFVSEAEYQAGNPLEFVITLPQQVPNSGDVSIRCQGEVVRVEPTGNGRIGVAAKIAHYEFVSAGSSI